MTVSVEIGLSGRMIPSPLQRRHRVALTNDSNSVGSRHLSHLENVNGLNLKYVPQLKKFFNITRSYIYISNSTNLQSKYHPDFNFSLRMEVVSRGLTYCLVISSPHLIAVVARTAQE